MRTKNVEFQAISIHFKSMRRGRGKPFENFWRRKCARVAGPLGPQRSGAAAAPPWQVEARAPAARLAAPHGACCCAWPGHSPAAPPA